MNILIVCAAGMSSSALAEKVRQYAHQQQRYDLKIGSCGSNRALVYARQADLVLIAPQISFLKETIDREGITRALIIPPSAYGMQDAEIFFDMINHPDRYMESESGQQKLKHCIGKLASNKALNAIKDGISDILPISIIGSVFSLLNAFPMHTWQKVIRSLGVNQLFVLGNDMTIGLLSVYLSMTISYHYAKSKDHHGTGVGLTSLVSFIIQTGAVQNGHLDMTYLGARGMFLSFVNALVMGELFCWLDEKLHYDTGTLPQKIAESFSVLLPTIICVSVSTQFSCIMLFTPYHSICSLCDAMLVQELRNMISDRPYSYLLLSLVASLLWFIGIHGGHLTGIVSDPVYLQASIENMAAYNAGAALPHMAVKSINHLYTFGGAGSTLSLSILMVLFARSSKLRSVGRISLPMGIFFINEPVIFGIPIFLNPVMFVPFVFIPFCSGCLTFYMMKIGILPYMAGFDLPWTTPPVLFGLLQGSLRLAVWQLVMILLQMLMWYPFFKIADRKACASERIR